MVVKEHMKEISKIKEIVYCLPESEIPCIFNMKLMAEKQTWTTGQTIHFISVVKQMVGFVRRKEEGKWVRGPRKGSRLETYWQENNSDYHRIMKLLQTMKNL